MEHTKRRGDEDDDEKFSAGSRRPGRHYTKRARTAPREGESRGFADEHDEDDAGERNNNTNNSVLSPVAATTTSTTTQCVTCSGEGEARTRGRCAPCVARTLEALEHQLTTTTRALAQLEQQVTSAIESPVCFSCQEPTWTQCCAGSAVCVSCWTAMRASRAFVVKLGSARRRIHVHVARNVVIRCPRATHCSLRAHALSMHAGVQPWTAADLRESPAIAASPVLRQAKGPFVCPFRMHDPNSSSPSAGGGGCNFTSVNHSVYLAHVRSCPDMPVLCQFCETNVNRPRPTDEECFHDAPFPDLSRLGLRSEFDTSVVANRYWHHLTHECARVPCPYCVKTTRAAGHAEDENAWDLTQTCVVGTWVQVQSHMTTHATLATRFHLATLLAHEIGRYAPAWLDGRAPDEPAVKVEARVVAMVDEVLARMLNILAVVLETQDAFVDNLLTDMQTANDIGEDTELSAWRHRPIEALMTRKHQIREAAQTLAPRAASSSVAPSSEPLASAEQTHADTQLALESLTKLLDTHTTRPFVERLFHGTNAMRAEYTRWSRGVARQAQRHEAKAFRPPPPSSSQLRRVLAPVARRATATAATTTTTTSVVVVENPGDSESSGSGGASTVVEHEPETVELVRRMSREDVLAMMMRALPAGDERKAAERADEWEVEDMQASRRDDDDDDEDEEEEEERPEDGEAAAEGANNDGDARRRTAFSSVSPEDWFALQALLSSPQERPSAPAPFPPPPPSEPRAHLPPPPPPPLAAAPPPS